MLSRIFSTLLLWSILLGSLYFLGAHAAVGLITILSALTLHEFYGMTRKMGLKPFHWMGVSIGVLMTAGPYYLSLYLEAPEIGQSIPMGLVVATLIISCARSLGERDVSNRIESIA
ncbi:MAG: hypothetical protein ABI273_10555, partial [Lacunisphaera sp.]